MAPPGRVIACGLACPGRTLATSDPLRKEVCIANLLFVTNETAYAGDDPRRLLSSTRELTRRVREAQRATWFPLLVLAAVTFAAIPTYLGGHRLGICVAVPPAGRACTAYSLAAIVYWPIALVLAYVAIAAFYIRRSQARGVGTRVRPYVIAGIVLAPVVTGATLWTVYHPLGDIALGLQPGLPFRLASPGCAIGIALLVLAWAERSRALLVLALGYLVIVLVPITFGWFTGRHGWTSLPLVLHGIVLLLGGIGFALAQRSSGQQPAQRDAP
jgi:hypothetical protein